MSSLDNKRKLMNLWKLSNTLPDNQGLNNREKLQWKFGNILGELKQNTTN